MDSDGLDAAGSMPGRERLREEKRGEKHPPAPPPEQLLAVNTTLSLQELRNWVTGCRDLGRVSPKSLVVSSPSFSGKSLDQVKGKTECS